MGIGPGLEGFSPRGRTVTPVTTPSDHGLALAEPDLRALLAVLRRRWLIILLVTAVAVAVAVVITLARTGTYRAETQLIVTDGAGATPATFSRTLRELVRSNVVAQNVIQDLRLDLTAGQLLDKLSVVSDAGSAVVTIRADDTSRARAQQIAQEAGLVFAQLVKQRFAEASANPTSIASGPTVTVFDPAHSTPGKVSPNTWRDIGIGAVLGVLLGLLAGFLRDALDARIRGREDAAAAFGVAVLGEIGRPGRKTHPLEGDIEALGALRASLQLLGRQRSLKTILVTSAGSSGSALPVAAGLAGAYARSGARVALVEADVRHPSLAGPLALGSSSPGLVEVLYGSSLEGAVRAFPVVSGEIDVLLSGARVSGAEADVLGTPATAVLLDRLAASYDVVVIGAPPLAAGADALELARYVDGTLVVVRPGQTAPADGARLRALLAGVGLELLGVVLSDTEKIRTPRRLPLPGRRGRSAFESQ